LQGIWQKLKVDKIFHGTQPQRVDELLMVRDPKIEPRSAKTLAKDGKILIMRDPENLTKFDDACPQN
jgi:hypothetical protein